MIAAIADTHAAIWYLFSDPRLGRAASAFIDATVAAGNHIGVSSAKKDGDADLKLVTSTRFLRRYIPRKRPRLCDQAIQLFRNSSGLGSPANADAGAQLNSHLAKYTAQSHAHRSVH
jgi:hypothetical protein